MLLRDYCAERNMGLMIVGIPHVVKVTIDDLDPSPFVDIGRRIGVPTVDLLEEFRTSAPDGGKPYYFPKDQHWTAAGHELAARVVASELRRQRLVPGKSD